MKSARVKYPRTNYFLSIDLDIYSIFPEYFFRTYILAVSISLLKSNPLTLSPISLNIDKNRSILAWSWIFFPRSYGLPHLWQIYCCIALDSVIFKSPSNKYGKLGKLIPKFGLSSLNHDSGVVYKRSSNSTPEWASNKRGTWPLPLTPQYPSLTCLSFGEKIALWGIKGNLIAFYLW